MTRIEADTDSPHISGDTKARIDRATYSIEYENNFPRSPSNKLCSYFFSQISQNLRSPIIFTLRGWRSDLLRSMAG